MKIILIISMLIIIFITSAHADDFLISGKLDLCELSQSGIIDTNSLENDWKLIISNGDRILLTEKIKKKACITDTTIEPTQLFFKLQKRIVDRAIINIKHQFSIDEEIVELSVTLVEEDVESPISSNDYYNLGVISLFADQDTFTNEKLGISITRN